MYPHQAGIGNMALFVPRRNGGAYEGALNEKTLTMAEALRSAGYRTLMSGKWHVGYPKDESPVARGFDHAFYVKDGASGYWKGKLLSDEKGVKQTRYLTDEFTDAAVRFVGESAGKSQPFFLYLAYTAPHYPLHAPRDEIAKYQGRYMKGWDVMRDERRERLVSAGLLDARWPLSPPDAPAWSDVQDKRDEDLKMAIYAAQVDRMDQGIGRVLAALRDKGVEKDTLVLFLSDNGASNEDSHPPLKKMVNGALGTPDNYDSYGTPWAHLSNTPFRSYKKSMYEGGIATPLIARWPGHVKAGSVTREVGHVVDLLATTLELAGARYPESFAGRTLVPLQGLSLVPVLEGGTRVGHERLFWEHLGSAAVREGRYKLVRARLKGAWELYDLEQDRTESRDLAAAQPERVAAMTQAFADWARGVGVEPMGNVKTAAAGRAAR